MSRKDVFTARASTGRTIKSDRSFDDQMPDHEEDEEKVSKHLAYILDGLAQEDDDVELDQAGLSLTAAIGKGQNIKETDVEQLFVLVPELLSIIVGRAMSKDARLFHGRGDLSANMWCCLHISQSLSDIKSVYPNLGDTHFVALCTALDKLLQRADMLTEQSKELPTVVVSLLSLWSPKISTTKEQFERIIPILTSYLDKEHSGIKASCGSLLESCHRYAPGALLSFTEQMVKAMQSGKLVLVPALAHLYEIQPDATHLFDSHVEWLFDMYEGRFAGVKGFSLKDSMEHRPAIAHLFKNIATNNNHVLETYIPRLVPGLKDPKTCSYIAQTLHAMALHNAPLQISIVDDVKEAVKCVPECRVDLMRLLAVIGASDRITAMDLADTLMRIVEETQQDLSVVKHNFQDMQSRGLLTKEMKVKEEAKIKTLHEFLPVGLKNIRTIAEKQSRSLVPLVDRLSKFLDHEQNEVREHAFFLSLTGAGGLEAGVRRCPREGSADSERHFDQEAVFATVFCRKHAPWEFYYEVHKAVRNVNMPLVLMQIRFDGKIGFFGGNVEEGDTVEETLARELREELNYNNASVEGGFEYLVSHEIPQEEFCEIEARSRDAQHLGCEVLGIMRAPLYCQDAEEGLQGVGFPNFLRNNFHQGVVEELIWLIGKKSLLRREDVETAAVAAGVQIDYLLPDSSGTESRSLSSAGTGRMPSSSGSQGSVWKARS